MFISNLTIRLTISKQLKTLKAHAIVNCKTGLDKCWGGRGAGLRNKNVTAEKQQWRKEEGEGREFGVSRMRSQEGTSLETAALAHGWDSLLWSPLSHTAYFLPAEKMDVTHIFMCFFSHHSVYEYQVLFVTCFLPMLFLKLKIYFSCFKHIYWQSIYIDTQLKFYFSTSISILAAEHACIQLGQSSWGCTTNCGLE